MSAINDWMYGSAGDLMDGASYEEIRQTVQELSAVTGMYCACFDSIGRCFIHAGEGQQEARVGNMWELPFFRDFQNSIRKKEIRTCSCLRYQGPAGREFLAAPLFLGGQYWGGVLLAESGHTDKAFPDSGRDAFFAFTEKILAVYAAAMQENVQAYRERLYLLQRLADWYPMENTIREKRVMFNRLCGRLTAYQADPSFYRDAVNAVHSLAVLEGDRETEDKYLQYASLQSLYAQKAEQLHTMREEAELCTLGKECLSVFCERDMDISLRFDREAEACVIPAFSLFLIAQAAVNALASGGTDWKLDLETQRTGDRIAAAIRGKGKEQDTSGRNGYVFDMLFNHEGESVSNLPEPGCRKAVRDLRARFRQKLSTSFAMQGDGGFLIQLTFPHRED